MKRFLLLASFLLYITLPSIAQNNGGDQGGAGSLLHVFPNPATSYITFNLDKGSGKSYSIEIYSFLGRKMFEQKNISDHTSVNLSDFQRGVYVYQLHDYTGRIVETGKFQVSK